MRRKRRRGGRSRSERAGGGEGGGRGGDIFLLGPQGNELILGPGREDCNERGGEGVGRRFTSVSRP